MTVFIWVRSASVQVVETAFAAWQSSCWQQTDMADLESVFCSRPNLQQQQFAAGQGIPSQQLIELLLEALKPIAK